MKKVSLVTLSVFGVALATPAAAALNAYLILRGSKTANFNPTVPSQIIVVQLRDGGLQEIVSPRDHASGLPTGKRMHKPLVITKELDKSSPLLMKAFQSREPITSATLLLFRKASDDQVEIYRRIDLEGVLIARVRQNKPGQGHAEYKLSDNKLSDNKLSDNRFSEHLTINFTKVGLKSLSKKQGLNAWKTAGPPE